MSIPALISAQRAKTAARKARRLEKAKRIGTAKPSLSKLKKTLWALLAPAIRQAYGPLCFTCGGNGNQTGHMFAKGRAHAISAWHPDNLRPQCFYCNINMGGNGAEFARRYIDNYGPLAFEWMSDLSKCSHKWTPMEIETLIEKIREGLQSYMEFYRENYGRNKGEQS